MNHIYREYSPIARPENTYISTADGRVYIKSNNGARVVVGRLVQDSTKMMHPNESFKRLYPDKWLESYGSKENLKSPILFIGLYAVVLFFACQSGLYDILVEKYGAVNANAMLDFTMFSFLAQSNAIHLFPETMENHALFSNTLHKDHWFSDFFNKNINPATNVDFKQTWLHYCAQRYNIKDIIISVSVDGSNIDCKAKNCDLAQKGKAKSKNNNNIVAFTWVLDAHTGLPLTYYVYDGNIPDCKILHNIVLELTDAGFKIDPIILDRNYATIDVIRELNSWKIPFVVNIKSNTNAHQEMVKEYKDKIPWNLDYSLGAGTLSGAVAVKKIFDKYDDTGYTYLYFDHIEGNERRIAYFSKIQKEYDRLKSQIQLGHIPTVKEEFSSFFTVLENEESPSVNIDYAKIHDAVTNKGFDSLVSNKLYTPKESDTIFNYRQVSEKKYSQLKNDFGDKAFRVHSTQGVLNKSQCWFVSGIIRTLIENAAKNVKIDANKAINSLNRIYCELFSQGYILVTKFSDLQKKLLNEIGINEDFISATLDFINSRTNSINDNIQNPIPPKFKFSSSETQETKEPTTPKDQNSISNATDTNSSSKETSSNSDVEVKSHVAKEKGKPGRPKGRKNNKTLEHEEELRAQGIDPDAPKEKGKPGRPKGRKNNKTLELEKEMRAQGIDPNAPKEKGKPGRPKGRSKNIQDSSQNDRETTQQTPSIDDLSEESVTQNLDSLDNQTESKPIYPQNVPETIQKTLSIDDLSEDKSVTQNLDSVDNQTELKPIYPQNTPATTQQTLSIDDLSEDKSVIQNLDSVDNQTELKPIYSTNDPKTTQ